jgi:hypothetical protein
MSDIGFRRHVFRTCRPRTLKEATGHKLPGQIRRDPPNLLQINRLCYQGTAMNRQHRIRLIASLLISLLGTAYADVPTGARDTSQFIGVYYPVVTGVAIDLHRCDLSHPILLTFAGSTQTTLGRAKFTQSHCEDVAHTSFTRGFQTTTFESGEQLFGKYHGTLLATPTTVLDGILLMSGFYRNTGGTGALMNAHGRGISAGTVDTATGAAAVTVSGSI